MSGTGNYGAGSISKRDGIRPSIQALQAFAANTSQVAGLSDFLSPAVKV
jgi:hypothetical protein